MQTMDQRIEALSASVSLVRQYEGHTIHRAAWEAMFTVWREGKCLESGLESFAHCLDWIETHKRLSRYQIIEKQRKERAAHDARDWIKTRPWEDSVIMS